MLWFDYLNLILIFSCIVVGAIYRKRIGLESIYILYFIVTFVLEIWSNIVMMQGHNNLWLYHLFIPVQLLILAYYFIKLLGRKTTRLLLGVPVIILMLILSFLYYNLSRYYSFISIIRNFVLIAFVLAYFRKILNSEFTNNAANNRAIWISTGLFINCLGSVFIEGFMNYVMHYDPNLATYLFYLDTGLYFLFYCTFIITLLAYH